MRKLISLIVLLGATILALMPVSAGATGDASPSEELL